MSELGDRIAERASMYAGMRTEELLGDSSEYGFDCGLTARKILSDEGIEVEGHLRDFGIEIPEEQRGAGDFVLLYWGQTQFKYNVPGHVSILKDPNQMIGADRGVVKLKDYKASTENCYKRIRRIVQ